MCASKSTPTEAVSTVTKGWKYWISSPFVLLIRGYQLIISPWLGNKCRYTPTCSQYGIQAFQKYGPLKGFWLTLKRVLSCHPWGGHGHDPVP